MDNIIADFQELCKNKFPEEACGCICNNRFIPLENEAEDKENFFLINYEQIEKVQDEQGEKVTAILHSHPNGTLAASYDDIKSQIAIGIPLGISVVSKDEYKQEFKFSPVYYIGKENNQLEGRPYIFGIYDCYSLVIDTMREKYNIRLPNFPREFGWEDTKDYFSDNFSKAGFVEIPVNDAQPGDCVLMTFHGISRKPIHCGVYIGDDTIIHHVGGEKPVDFSRLSVSEPINRWMPNIVKWLRYNA